MKSKKIIAAILIPTFMQFANFSVASADTLDDEFAMFAAEQRDSDDDKTRLSNEPQKPKTKKELKEERKRLKKQRKEEEERLEEERKAARKAIKEGKKAGKKNKTPEPQRRTTPSNIPTLSDFEKITDGEKLSDPDTGSSVVPPTPEKLKDIPREEDKPEIPREDKPEIPATQPETNNLQNETPAPEPLPQPENKPLESQPVGLPNPMVEHSNFNDLVRAVHFNPLYIPKKSGYTINKIFSISNRTAEIRYKRRWEPEVSLSVRTYKRDPGESLKDISGIHGVQWRIDLTSGTSIYIAKVSDTQHAAAWAVGQYTFSAVAENLSYAAFHSLVTEELADLSTHYYIS